MKRKLTKSVCEWVEYPPMITNNKIRLFKPSCFKAKGWRSKLDNNKENKCLYCGKKRELA